MYCTKNLLLLAVIMACFNQLGLGQTQFQKTAGTPANDRNYHMTMLQDGSPVATGYTEAITGNQKDAFLIKYNRFGEVDWAKTYGDIGDETSWDVITTDNDQLVGGGVSGSLGTPHNAATITRVDADGNVIWATGVYGPDGNVEFYRIMQTSTGEFVATGLAGTAGKADDIVLCKFSNAGSMLWSRIIGSAQSDEAMGMAETSQGHYLVAGLSNDNSGNGSSDFTVVKTDTSGQVIWKKIYGGTSGERLNGVVEVNNSYYVTGWSSSTGQGQDDIIIMNLDTAGNINWVKSYGTVEDDRSFSMLYDAGANAIIIGGYTDYAGPGISNRNTLLLSVDLSGDLNWAKSYGSSGEDGHWPTGLAQNDDAGYYVMGSSNSFGLGNMDLYLTKTDANGNTACNQQSPNINVADVTGWTGTNFGSANNANLTAVSLAFNGSIWSPTSTSLCCQLYAEAGNSGYQCPGDTAIMGSPPLPGYSYTWSLGGTQVGTGAFYEVPYGEGGTYMVTASASGSGCTTASDLVGIVDEPKPELGLQSLYEFCEGDSVTVTTTAAIDSLKWYSKAEDTIVQLGSSFTGSRTDTMILQTYNNTCLFLDTLVFHEIDLPVFELGKDTAVCLGDSVIIQAPTGYPFQWLHDPSITDSIITTDTAGTFILQLTNQFCTYADTLTVSLLPLPAFSLGNDTSLCEGDSLLLEVPATFEVIWMNDPAITSPTYTIGGAGLYFAQVSDTNQCSSTDSILVKSYPLPVFSLGNDTAICKEDSIMLQVPAMYDHTWLHDPSITEKSITVGKEGTYSARVTDQHQCSFTDSVKLTIHPLPVFSLGNDTAFCEGGFTVIQAPLMYDHLWLHDTSIVSKSILADTTGLFIAQVTDINGCRFTDSISVMVHPLPTLSFGPDTAFCEGDSLILEIPAQYDHTWLHDTTIQEKTIVVKSTGRYSARVTDVNGCMASDSINVTINPLPVFSLGRDTAFCEGGSIELAAPAQYDHIWLHDTTITAKKIRVNTTGTYILETRALRCKYRDTIHVQVHPLPTISLGPDQSICPDSMAVITAEGDFNTFAWTNISSVEDTLYVDTNATIIAQGGSTEGCRAYDTVMIHVYYLPDSIFQQDTVTFSGSAILDAGSIYMAYHWSNDSITQTISVTASGWYTVTVTSVDGCELTDSVYAHNISGISEIQPAFTVYPNPVREQLIVKMEHVSAHPVFATVISVTGRELRTVKLIGNGAHTVPVANLAQGIFLLELRVGDRRKKVIRFVKE